MVIIGLAIATIVVNVFIERYPYPSNLQITLAKPGQFIH